VHVHIDGLNDLASISGTSTGDVTEDTQTSAQGTLTVVDPDQGQSHTQSATNVASDHGLGTYTVDADGHWTYNVNNALIQHLGANDTAHDTFTVTSLDGSTSQQITITIHGTNDGPAVTGAVTGAATEDGAASTLDALANASDVDDNTTLSVVGIDPLPAGVSYDALAHSFTLDPSNGAFQHLAQGQQATVTVNYGVSDGIATTAASVSWTVTGTNDAPVLSASAGSDHVSEGGSLALSISATDPDDNASLSYTISGVSNGASLDHGINLGSGVWSLTPGQLANLHLLAGEDGPLNLNVTVTDEHGASNSHNIALTVNPVAEPPTLNIDGINIPVGSSTQPRATPSPKARQ